MYAPHHFAVTDEAEVDAVLRVLRLGCLTTHDPAAGLQATHMPFLYDAERRTLDAHMARANPHWERAGDGAALVIFQGVNAYVSPSWHPSKYVHGRVVPTWNYEAVHVRGRIDWRHEPDWLIAHVSALSGRHEASRAVPWAVSDAPEDYIRGLANGIVGLELAIEQVEVTRKLSQNRSQTDQQGVIAGLSASEAEADRVIAAISRR
ncbi:MAG TPA: FMN-binding negative transcriptional regulator [Caulobacteraceae bacterium]|jgi:transcriptional regulator|nr:FMN-binding negative transcriptional regulator [Caulobacteraceae bacterium]